MRSDNQFFKGITLTALLFCGFAVDGIAQDTNMYDDPETQAPTILATTPSDGEENVDLSGDIEITFSIEMDEATINENTLMLHANSAGTMHDEYEEMWDEEEEMDDRRATRDSDKRMQDNKDAVKGSFSYSDKIAVFTPDEELEEGTEYTFTVTTDVKSSENVALEEEYTWSFTTMDESEITYYDQQGDEQYDEQADEQTDRYRYDRSETQDRSEHMEMSGETGFIDLGTAGEYVVLAKDDINHKSESRITGRTGEGSKAEESDEMRSDRSDRMEKDRAYADSVRQQTSDDVLVLESNESQRDTTAPEPDLSQALEDMMSAFDDASMQSAEESKIYDDENFQTAELTPGVHEWNNSVDIESDVTLSGGEDDVWLIKVTDNLTVNENTMFTLSSDVRSENVFWYVEGEVSIGENAHFEGIILSMEDITLEKGATLNGRMYSQSSITLDDNTISEPQREYDPITRINR